MDYAAVRDALARALEGDDRLVAVHATVPEKVTAPSAAIVPGEPVIEFHRTAHGVRGAVHRLVFDVIVFAARFDSAHGQDTLDGFLSTLPDLIEADQTLGGTAEVAVVTDATNYGLVTIADSSFVGCRIGVEVYVR